MPGIGRRFNGPVGRQSERKAKKPAVGNLIVVVNPVQVGEQNEWQQEQAAQQERLAAAHRRAAR